MTKAEDERVKRATTEIDWSEGLDTLVRALMIIVRWAQKTKEKLRRKDE